MGYIHFFMSANGGFSAGLVRFGHRNCLSWTICCRMMYSHLNLMQEMDIWVESPKSVLTLNAVITGRDDVVHYCGVWDSSRRTTVLFSSVIKVIDLYC